MVQVRHIQTDDAAANTSSVKTDAYGKKERIFLNNDFRYVVRL